MNTRPTFTEYFLKIAEIVSTRSTCYRRQVGCVLTDNRHHILSTGYNGVAPGTPHCNEHPTFKCKGADEPSGQSLELCEAIHAEQNALLQCKDVHDIHTAYISTCPCVTCMKLFMCTSVLKIYYRDEYTHPSSHTLANRCGIQLIRVPGDKRL